MCSTEKRSDLPTVAPQGRFEISWVRRLIGFTDPTQLKIATEAKLWHSGIIIKDLDSDMIMLVQYEALNFEPSSFYPEVSASREIVWNNSAVVGWLPSSGDSPWPLSIKIGVVSGTVLNKWFDWVPGWRKNHPHYQLFAVWDRAGMFPALRKKFEFFRDSCCHSFTEEGLGAFHDAGADFSSMTEPLCRNYFVIIQDTFRPIEKVDVTDAKEWNKVVDFYDGLQHLVGNKIGTITDSIKIWIQLVLKFGYTAYLADSDLSNYHRVHLSIPYMTYLLQRMKLPWQTGGNPRECWAKENLTMPQDVQEHMFGQPIVV